MSEIPDGSVINNVARNEETHLDNLADLLPGLPEELADELLEHVHNGTAQPEFRG